MNNRNMTYLTGDRAIDSGSAGLSGGLSGLGGIGSYTGGITAGTAGKTVGGVNTDGQNTGHGHARGGSNSSNMDNSALRNQFYRGSGGDTNQSRRLTGNTP